MIPIAEAFMKELPLGKKDFWENELKSLGIEPKRMENDLNDKRELEALAEIINKSITKIIKWHMFPMGAVKA